MSGTVQPSARAVVFAYHNVGVRCLATLLDRGVQVALVVTHRDNPNENIWFGSVQALAQLHGIPVITPEDPNTDEVLAQVKAAAPEFLFSFYYRHMLKKPLLEVPTRGAYNMHGSLLPKYRGRVPTNWAVIHGETETGATLHVMNEKPDNGALVAQQAVPILINDTAQDVFDKVTVAAEMALHGVLPALLAGTAPLVAQDLSKGGYFGGRKAEDGRLDFAKGALAIHNFVRAVTRPYPGAFTDVGGRRIIVWRTILGDGPAPRLTGQGVRLGLAGEQVVLLCADGGWLRVVDLDLAGQPASSAGFAAAFGGPVVQLG